MSFEKKQFKMAKKFMMAPGQFSQFSSKSFETLDLETSINKKILYK
jgi:hypothetical protein